MLFSRTISFSSISAFGPDVSHHAKQNQQKTKKKRRKHRENPINRRLPRLVLIAFHSLLSFRFAALFSPVHHVLAWFKCLRRTDLQHTKATIEMTATLLTLFSSAQLPSKKMISLSHLPNQCHVMSCPTKTTRKTTIHTRLYIDEPRRNDAHELQLTNDISRDASEVFGLSSFLCQRAYLFLDLFLSGSSPLQAS